MVEEAPRRGLGAKEWRGGKEEGAEEDVAPAKMVSDCNIHCCVFIRIDIRLSSAGSHFVGHLLKLLKSHGR